MPIPEDVVYLYWKNHRYRAGMHEVHLDESDFFRVYRYHELLGHLDYLEKAWYIKWVYRQCLRQQDVPSAVEAKEFDFRVANSFGAVGPLPLITFKSAELTEKGRKMLEKMDANLRSHLRKGHRFNTTKDMPFLERLWSSLEDIFDARDVTEVIYRAIRDLMTTEAVERVADELHKALPTKDKALQMEIQTSGRILIPLLASLAIRAPFTIRKAATSLMLMTSAFSSGQKWISMAATGFDVDRRSGSGRVFCNQRRIIGRTN